MNEKSALVLPRKAFLLLGVTLGIFFWLLESAVHTYILQQGPYWSQVFTRNPHEIGMRGTIFLLLVAFGAFAQYAHNRCKKNEEKLEQAYAELEQIFNTAADGMVVIDLDFNIIRMNDTYLKMVGISRKESLGKKCYQVCPGPECHTSQCPLHQILMGVPRVELRVEKETRNGTKIPCLLTAVPFKERNGKVIGIMENFRDISVWIQAQKEKEKLQERLEEAMAKALSGFLPICASCKRIRDEKGQWIHVENYIKKHTEAVPSHSICPDCMTKLYPDLDTTLSKDEEE